MFGFPQYNNRDTQTSLGFRDTNGSPSLSQTTRPCDNQQQKREPAE